MKWMNLVIMIKTIILSLNSIINIRSLTIIIKSVFKDNNKFFPQIYLTDCRYNKV